MGSITKLQVKAFSHTLRLIKRSSCPAVHVLIGTVRQNSKYRSTPKLRRETQSVRMLPKYGSSGFLKKTHGIYYQTPCKSFQSYPKIDQRIPPPHPEIDPWRIWFLKNFPNLGLVIEVTYVPYNNAPVLSYSWWGWLYGTVSAWRLMCLSHTGLRLQS